MRLEKVLDEGNVLIARQLTALGGHNAGSDRVVQTEGATDGGHPFADLQFVAVAHREVRQILGFDLDDGDVGLGIRTEHFAREFTIVGETHFDFVGAVNNVVIGKNQTVCSGSSSVSANSSSSPSKGIAGWRFCCR